MRATYHSGFTLIEIILALTVSGILAVMLSTYLLSSLSSSGAPMDNLRDTLAIYTVMENIQIDYEHNTSIDLDALKAQIGDPTANPQTNSYGSYNVVFNDYINCDAASSTTFSTGTSTPKILMVTITDQQRSGIKITLVLAE